MSAWRSRPAPAPPDAVSYADLYARWERGNWRATEIDFSQDRDRLARADDRRAAPQRAVALRALLPRRGLGHRQPLALHRRRAAARSRSTSSPPSRSTRRATPSSSSASCTRSSAAATGPSAACCAAPRPSSRGATARSSRASTHGRRAARGPLAAQARRGGHALPRRRRGDARPARPAHDRALPRGYDLLPGFREGMRNVALDEQRHIAFGVRLLADLYREEPRAGHRTRSSSVIREVAAVDDARVAMPPNWDRSLHRVLRLHARGPLEAGARSHEARLRAVGLPRRRPPALPAADGPPAARARAARAKLLRAGLLGPGDGPSRATPRPSRSFRHAPPRGRRARSAARHDDPVGLPRRRPVVPRARPRPLRAVPGAPPERRRHAALRFADFADVIAGRADPRR